MPALAPVDRPLVAGEAVFVPAAVGMLAPGVMVVSVTDELADERFGVDEMADGGVDVVEGVRDVSGGSVEASSSKS